MTIQPGHRAGLVALVLLGGPWLAACSESAEGNDSGIEAATHADAPLAEIEITTISESALADFVAGQDALDVGDYTAAEALFARAVEEDPDFAYAHLNLARTARSFPEFDRHLESAVRAAATASEGEQLLIAIRQTVLDNDTQKRLALSEELVEKYPGSPRAWLNLAEVQWSLNRNEDARAAISRAIRLDPGMAAAHSLLGFQYLFAEPKDFAKAEANMRRFIELRPEEGKGYEYLGDVMRAQGKLKRAAAAYSRAVDMDSTNAVAALKKGHINSFLGDYDRARSAYDAALAVAEIDVRPDYANYRAFTRIHEGDIDGALAELAGIVAGLDTLPIPDDRKRSIEIFTLNNSAIVALHYGRLGAAERILARLAELEREVGEAVGSPQLQRMSEAHIALWEGKLAARRCDFEQARARAADYRRLVEQDNNPRKLEAYHELLGLIALEQEAFADAVEHYRQADLTSMYVKYHLGLAEEGAGNEAGATEIFREVSEWNFNSVGYALVRQETTAKVRAAAR